MADRATDTPVTARTTFEIASVTKAFIGALALKLAQERRVSLSEPLSDTLPRWPYAEQITLRDLLAQRSGVSNAIMGPAVSRALFSHPRELWSTGRLLGYDRRPSLRPGAGWEYNNANYLLAGLVLEHATHEPVATLLRQQILDPLGLKDVVLQPQQRPTPDTAHGYFSPDYFHEHDLWDGTGYVPDRAWASYWTAGGIVASAPSVAKFGDAVIRGALLNPAAQREMTSFAPTRTPGGYTAYALGLGQLFRPDLWIAVGDIPGFGSTLAYLPARHITAAVLANEDGSTAATLNIAQVLIQTAEHH